MNRLTLTVVTAALCSLTSLACGVEKPNIELILTDDVGAECFGQYDEET